jgi:hypothetical protein
LNIISNNFGNSRSPIKSNIFYGIQLKYYQFPEPIMHTFSIITPSYPGGNKIHKMIKMFYKRFSSNSTQSFPKPKPRLLRKAVFSSVLFAYGYYQWAHYKRNKELAKNLDIPFYKVFFSHYVTFILFIYRLYCTKLFLFPPCQVLLGG